MNIVPPAQPMPPKREQVTSPSNIPFDDDPFAGIDQLSPQTHQPQPQDFYDTGVPLIPSSNERQSLAHPTVPQAKMRVEPVRRRYRHMRIEWADISRGIGLLAFILVVVSMLFTTGIPDHVPPTLDASILAKIAFSPTDPLSNYSSLLSSFACPLLFMCIGYTMRKQKFSFSYIRDLVGKYMTPYLVFGVIVCIIGSILDSHHNALPWLFALVYGNGGERADMVLGQPFDGVFLPLLWIMPTIMIAQLMTFVLSKIPLLTRLALAGVLFVGGSASAGHVFLPLDIQPAMCATWFMVCGTILRETHAFSSWGWEKILFGICLTFGVAYSVLISLGFITVPDYAVANYQNGIVDMLGGVCAGASFMLLSQVISLWGGPIRRVLCWIGENFLAILSCATFVIAPLRGMPWIIENVGMMIGTIPTLIIFSIATVVLAILGALLISKIPFIRSLFDHFAVENGYKSKS